MKEALVRKESRFGKETLVYMHEGGCSGTLLTLNHNYQSSPYMPQGGAHGTAGKVAIANATQSVFKGCWNYNSGAYSQSMVHQAYDLPSSRAGMNVISILAGTFYSGFRFFKNLFFE